MGLRGDSRHQRRDRTHPGLSRKHDISKVPRTGGEHEPNGATPDDSVSGKAALLLVESLIHHLVSRSILSVSEAIEIVDIAAEVESEMALAERNGEAKRVAATSLAAIANSLRYDLNV